MKEINNNFLFFVKHVWKDFIEGSHHKKISEKFNLLSKKKIQRLIINIPPRHTKSSFASFLFPAWMLGRNPNIKISQISYNPEASTYYLSKTKKLIDNSTYKKIFKTRLKNSVDKNKLETVQGGLYNNLDCFDEDIADLDIDLLIIDDPHSAEDLSNIDKLKETFDWYSQKLFKSLQPGTVIVLIMSRCNINDLTGKLLHPESKIKEMDEWEILKLPVISPKKEPLWPDFWKLDELQKIRNTISNDEWNFKWMQDTKK